LFDLFVPKGA
jgi:hypothetical protein